MTILRRIIHSKSSWPRWLIATFDAAMSRVPENIALRLNPAKYGFTAREIPPPPLPPNEAVRLYIAPVNFASQGYLWARSSELLPGVGAVSMQYRLDADYGFPSDNAVPVRVFRKSRKWQRAQFETVASQFTHVIYEAERPIFGELFDLSPLSEITALRDRGVKVAMLTHGSDLRLPSRHRNRDQWSPFHDSEWDQIPVLEAQAKRHRELLAAVGAPVFASTPDLLLDWPTARWIPLVVDSEKWRSDELPLRRDRPVVVHAPSKAVIKGSDLIEPAMRKLHDLGLIEYRRVQGLPAPEMPALYRGADIVLEQFRIGTYSVAAIEAMAAGRVVVAHVHEQVREHVMKTYDHPVPVVQATVDSLESVVRSIIDEREKYQLIAAAGPRFVERVHDGKAAAEVLRDFLLGD